MESCNGMFVLYEPYRIGNLLRFFYFSASYTPRVLGVLRETKCYEILRGVKNFFALSFHKMLIVQHSSSFRWKRIRRSHVSSKVIFFIWTALLGNILTIYNVRNCGLLLWIGVSCVKIMQNLWIIYICIAR